MSKIKKWHNMIQKNMKRVSNKEKNKYNKNN